MKKEQEIDWRPNWKDESQYPNPKKMSSEEWAWEFARRNPEYQKDYNSLTKDLPTLKEQKDDWSKYEPIVMAIKNHFSQKFGVSYARNPALGFSKHLKFQRQPTIVTKPKIKNYEMNYGEILVSIDLLKPIKSQLASLEKELEKQSEIFRELNKEPINKKRLQTEKYKNYLRILDAKYKKERSGKIAKILYPGIKDEYPEHAGRDRVKADYKAAKKLQKRDYFFIC